MWLHDAATILFSDGSASPDHSQAFNSDRAQDPPKDRGVLSIMISNTLIRDDNGGLALTPPKGACACSLFGLELGQEQTLTICLSSPPRKPILDLKYLDLLKIMEIKILNS